MSSLPPSRSPRVTIRQVAELAGVGIKTVSRVINNEPNVAPATAARVRMAIEELRWKPDTTAANLRRTVTRTQSVGLLLGSVANPFAAVLHRAVEDVAVARDVAVFAASLDDDAEREVAAVEAFVFRQIDGLILTSVAESQRYLAELVPPEVPIVFIDRAPTDFPAASVVSDNSGGIRLATEHLLKLGHRKLALLIDRRQLWTARERERGFLDALTAHSDLAIDPIIVADITDEHEAERAVAAVLSGPDRPTAIVSAQNLLTIGALHALRGMGLHREIALVGFDDVDLADLLEPGLTVVAQRPQEMGRVASDLVFAALDTGEPIEPATTLIPVDLIRRGSGEIPPPVR